MQTHILVVEDEIAINDLIRTIMEMVGYRVTSLFDGNDVLPLVAKERFDLLLLDVMLPGMDGFTIYRNLPEGTPAIFITARMANTDEAYGLKLGAEDYIVKPIESIVLTARVERALARHRRAATHYRAHGVLLDLSTRIVTKDDRPVPLTPKEYDLLEFLMRNPNIALSRDQILGAAWRYDYAGGTRTIDVHVMRLREKLGWNDRIQVIPKFGYRLVVDE